MKATRSSVSSDELPEKGPNGRKKGASTVFFTFCVFQKKAKKIRKNGKNEVNELSKFLNLS